MVRTGLEILNEVLKEVDHVGGSSKFHVGRFSEIDRAPRRRSGVERGEMGFWMCQRVRFSIEWIR